MQTLRPPPQHELFKTSVKTNLFSAHLYFPVSLDDLQMDIMIFKWTYTWKIYSNSCKNVCEMTLGAINSVVCIW